MTWGYVECVTDRLSSTADWWGRRKSLSFGVIVFIVGVVIQLTAMDSWVHMMMGRFVAGLGIGNLSVGVPMFQSECSPREIRGAVVASYQLLITLGILISNCVNYGVRSIESSSASWRIVVGLGIAFSLPLGIGVLFVPESPRWLAARSDWEGARMAMARLRGLKDDPGNELVEDDMREMRDLLEKERSVGVGTWKECFVPEKNGVPKQVYRTALGMAIHFLQQWTGVNYFFYYGATIFESAGIDDPIRTQLILGAINVACTFYGLYVVERYGRRWPLLIGALWQAAWLAVFASMGTALNPEGNRTSGIVMIVSACMFIASFAATWGPICWVVIGETFPLRTRAKQASIATATNWLGNCKTYLLYLTRRIHASSITSQSFLHTFLKRTLTHPDCLNSHDLVPHAPRDRRHRVRVRLRLRRHQHRRRAADVVLPLRVGQPQPRERRPHVQPARAQALGLEEVDAPRLHLPPQAGRRLS